MLRGRRLPLPQSPSSRWRTTAPVPARLFSTTAPRLDNSRGDEKPFGWHAHAEDEQRRQPSQEKPLFSKVRVQSDDWALLQGRLGAKINPKHVHLSLEGRTPFGADRVEQFRSIDAVNILPRQEVRKPRDKIKRFPEPLKSRSLSGPERLEKTGGTRKGGLRPPQRGSRGPEDSQKTTRGKAWSPRVPRRADDLQDVYRRDSLVWRSIIHREPETVDKRGPSDAAEAPCPKGPDRRTQLNKIKITIASQPKGNRLSAQATGDLKKETARNPGFDSLETTPTQVREAINRQVSLTAAESPTLSTPRPPKPVGQTQTTPSQPKPRAVEPDLSEFPGSIGVMGPAESIRNLLSEDPILKEAQLLSRGRVGPMFDSQSPSKLDVHGEPRFRVLPTSQWLQRKNAKASESGPLGGAQKATVSFEPEAQQASDQETQATASSSQPGTVKPTALQEMEAQIVASQSAHFEKKKQAESEERLKPAEPVQPERSIFEQLFSEERPRGDSYWRIADRLRSAFSAVEKDLGPDAEREVPKVAPQSDQSIFGQLFPEEVGARSASSEEWVRETTGEPLTPPKDSLLISLRNEVRNWIPADQQERITGPQPGEYGSHSTVVVISGTSPSLIETDFFRIAPEGQHVEGWAGGLVKVVQARDSITFEPLGQYYLMFHSRPSALAYVDEVRRLHALSRRLLHAPAASGREVAKGPLDQAPASPQPFLTDEEQAAVRSFTLLSPSLPPNISVRLWNTRLVQDIAARSDIADVVETLRPEAATPAKVLLKINNAAAGSGSGSGGSGGGSPGEDPGGLTTDELWLTLRDDGRERSAPWVLANLSQGIMPVKPVFSSASSGGIRVKSRPVAVPTSSELDDEFYDDEGAAGGESVAGQLPSSAAATAATERKLGGGGGAGRHERFSRFILTFTQPAIARRFVRCWHKRAIYDAVLGRSVVVDAVALM
ncbi:hypothetical protein VPNG_01729 [Cytospora leucostoma]|uniref:Uncharacterized protein n=1 Tax=Cytospora leucostoma TaxID=1230097 RepID=A0A423XJS0_9PEZI|nr:hypothetical protein VPNG_01729 [Cytospora leucostoma]